MNKYFLKKIRWNYWNKQWRWLQDVLLFPSDVWHSVACYIDNRFRVKTHTLKTTLEKGVWHDFDERLTRSVIEGFIDFIEGELVPNTLSWNEGSIQDTSYNGVLKFFVELQMGYDTIELFGEEAVKKKEETWKEILAMYKEACYIIRERKDILELEFADWHEELLKEQEYEKQDEELMIKIVKHRKTMWT